MRLSSILRGGEGDISGIHLVSASTSIGTENEKRFMSSTATRLFPGLVPDDTETSSRTLQEFVQNLFFLPSTVQDYYFILGYNTIVPSYVRRGYLTPQHAKEAVLSRITKPFLLTHGIEDRLVLFQQTLYNQRIIMHNHVSLYTCTSHPPFWENPRRFNEKLTWFTRNIAR